MSVVRINMKGNEWNFIIWEENNKLWWQLSAEFATQGSCSIETTETEVIRKVLKAHYEPRYMVDLAGNKEKYEPFYDDPRLFPGAFDAKRRMEDITVQQELFTK